MLPQLSPYLWFIPLSNSPPPWSILHPLQSTVLPDPLLRLGLYDSSRPSQEIWYSSDRFIPNEGPVVRLSSTMVDISSPEAAVEAWAGHNESRTPWDKDPQFSRMVRGGLEADNVLSISGAREALRIRRLVGAPFAKKFLAEQEHIFKACTKKLIEKIEEDRKSGPVDVARLFMEYSFDLLSTSSCY